MLDISEKRPSKNEKNWKFLVLPDSQFSKYEFLENNLSLQTVTVSD